MTNQTPVGEQPTFNTFPGYEDPYLDTLAEIEARTLWLVSCA